MDPHYQILPRDDYYNYNTSLYESNVYTSSNTDCNNLTDDEKSNRNVILISIFVSLGIFTIIFASVIIYFSSMSLLCSFFLFFPN